MSVSVHSSVRAGLPAAAAGARPQRIEDVDLPRHRVHDGPRRVRARRHERVCVQRGSGIAREVVAPVVLGLLAHAAPRGVVDRHDEVVGRAVRPGVGVTAMREPAHAHRPADRGQLDRGPARALVDHAPRRRARLQRTPGERVALDIEEAVGGGRHDAADLRRARRGQGSQGLAGGRIELHQCREAIRPQRAVAAQEHAAALAVERVGQGAGGRGAGPVLAGRGPLRCRRCEHPTPQGRQHVHGTRHVTGLRGRAINAAGRRRGGHPASVQASDIDWKLHHLTALRPHPVSRDRNRATPAQGQHPGAIRRGDRALGQRVELAARQHARVGQGLHDELARHGIGVVDVAEGGHPPAQRIDDQPLDRHPRRLADWQRWRDHHPGVGHAAAGRRVPPMQDQPMVVRGRGRLLDDPGHRPRLACEVRGHRGGRELRHPVAQHARERAARQIPRRQVHLAQAVRLRFVARRHDDALDQQPPATLDEAYPHRIAAQRRNETMRLGVDDFALGGDEAPVDRQRQRRPGENARTLLLWRSAAARGLLAPGLRGARRFGAPLGKRCVEPAQRRRGRGAGCTEVDEGRHNPDRCAPPPSARFARPPARARRTAARHGAPASDRPAPPGAAHASNRR